jgi:uncharacterized membrane protein YesL
MNRFLMPMIAPFISKIARLMMLAVLVFALSVFWQKPFCQPLIGCSLSG